MHTLDIRNSHVCDWCFACVPNVCTLLRALLLWHRDALQLGDHLLLPLHGCELLLLLLEDGKLLSLNVCKLLRCGWVDNRWWRCGGCWDNWDSWVDRGCRGCPPWLLWPWRLIHAWSLGLPRVRELFLFFLGDHLAAGALPFSHK